MGSRRGIYVAPFDELADPRLLAELAAAAERRGFDGFFLWDHIRWTGVDAVLDPWVALAAIAMTTERIRFGPMVTPLARRRIQKLARETATLDVLGGGRLVLGVGLGSDRHRELAEFGDEADGRRRARLLDDGLAQLGRCWDGEFLPRPVQRPRIPIWAAAKWPHRRPVRRAAHWDGLFPVELPGPDALAELCAEVEAHRPDPSAPFDIVVTNRPGTDPEPWERAGATWCLTGWGPHPPRDEVRAVIAAGPGG